MTRQRDVTLLLMFYYDGQFPWNIPYLLYYPVNVLYQVPFRYEKRWISESLRDKDYFPLQEALIVMKFSELEDSDRQEYIPIRKVTITKSERIGDYFYLYLKLGIFVKYEENGLFQFSKDFRTSLEMKDRHKLVEQVAFKTPLIYTDPENEKEEIDSWFRLAKLISTKSEPRMEEYEHTVFLKFQSLSSSSNHATRPIPLYRGLEITLLEWLAKYFSLGKRLLKYLYDNVVITDNWGYKLKVGSMYSIKILQFFRPDEKLTFSPKDAILRLDIPKESFFLTKQLNPIIGHQDILLFTFITTNNRIIDTPLVIKPQDGSKPTYQIKGIAEEHKLFLPEISLPAQVRYTFWAVVRFYVLPIIAFLLGSLLVTTSTVTTLSLPIQIPQSSTLTDSTIRVVELALGLLFQAIGLYILKSDKD